jgi:O-antigen/teichoic acid export membrane protein
VFNAIVVAAYSFIIVALVLQAVGAFFFAEISKYVFLLVAVLAFVSVFTEILLVVFQIERKAFNYAAFQVARTVFTAGLSLVLIVFYEMGWMGKFLADIFVVSWLAVMAVAVLRKDNNIDFHFDRSKQTELAKYLFPLTFHVLGLVLMNSIDRVFLSSMLGLEATGMYTVAYTIGALIGVIHDALLKVWSPEFYMRIKEASAAMRSKILKFQVFYVFSSFVILGLFIVLAPFVFEIMIDQKFRNAYPVVPFVALGLTFEALRKLIIGYLYNKGHNKTIAGLTLSSGIGNAAMNAVLIPKFGIMGAAYATVLAYFFVFCVTVVAVIRVEGRIL